MPVTAPADRRFKRAHLKPARKRAGLGSWRVRGAIASIVIALSLYAGHRAIAVVAGLEVFHVNRINVRGNHRLSKGEVLAMMQGLHGRSVLSVDLAQWRQALMGSPWIADASLRKSLPSTIDVVILERAPLGIGRINGSLYLVDDRGSVIDDYGPNYGDLDLPIIDGLTGRSNADEAEHLDLHRALLARRLLDALRARNMSTQISQIDVSDSQNAVVLLDGDPTLIRLGNERFVERLQSYLRARGRTSRACAGDGLRRSEV